MGWYEALKDAITAADRLKDAGLKQQLANVQMECAALAEENARLREESLSLKEQIRNKNALSFRDNVHWMARDGGGEEGPYCPKCWGGEQKLARMQDRSDDDWWRCLVCDRTVAKPGPGRDALASSGGGDWDPLNH